MSGRAIAIGCAAVVGSLWIGYHVVFQLYRVSSSGMEPTIEVGDHALTKRGSAARRGDVIAFVYPPQPKYTYLKRVVAVGGDTVEIRAKKLFVNGREVTEPYAVHTDEQTYPNESRLPEPYRSRDWYSVASVPANTYFVLGDNRDRSSDSRYWGFLPAANVRGRAILTYSVTRGVRPVH